MLAHGIPSLDLFEVAGLPQSIEPRLHRTIHAEVDNPSEGIPVATVDVVADPEQGLPLFFGDVIGTVGRTLPPCKTVGVL